MRDKTDILLLFLEVKNKPKRIFIAHQYTRAYLLAVKIIDINSWQLDKAHSMLPYPLRCGYVT